LTEKELKSAFKWIYFNWLNCPHEKKQKKCFMAK
jgi:hypothetical protein